MKDRLLLLLLLLLNIPTIKVSEGVELRNHWETVGSPKKRARAYKESGLAYTVPQQKVLFSKNAHCNGKPFANNPTDVTKKGIAYISCELCWRLPGNAIQVHD